MKKVIVAFLMCFSLLTAGLAQHLTTPKLIIRADDMGATHAINQAFIQCAKEGIMTSIELMVTLPWLPEAIRMLQENPGLDVGIHLDLNSEWDLYKPRPLTQCTSLTDENGYFYPYINPDPKLPGKALLEYQWTLEDVEKEFRAQLELGLKLFPQITHFSGHMGCTGFDKQVVDLAHKLAAEYQLADIGSDPLEAYNLMRVTYIGPKRTLAEKEESFIKMLESLEPGNTYFFVDHPGYDTDEMHPISYKGVADVGFHRQGVTDLFCSDKVKAVIAEKGIELVSYGEIAKPK